MATNNLRPEEWPDIVNRIRNASDADVGAFLAERERRFDNFFQTIGKEEVGTISAFQNSAAVAASLTDAVGIRVGTFVFLNLTITLTAGSTGAGTIMVTAPVDLPVVGASINPVGVMMFFDLSLLSTTQNITHVVNNDKFSLAGGTTTQLAIGDILGISVQYRTSATAVM